MNNTELLAIVLKIYKKCNITKFPFDCAAVLESFGYKVIPYSKIQLDNPELYELCKAMSYDAFTHVNKKYVMFNDNMNKGRIRFSLMHELGHIVLNHSDQTKDNDIEADNFAATILAPYIMIYEYSCKTYLDVRRRFGLSYKAANVTLAKCRYWQVHEGARDIDYEIYNWFAKYDYWLTHKIYISRPLSRPRISFDYSAPEMIENPMVLGLE